MVTSAQPFASIRAASREPLADKALVFQLAGFRAVRNEIVIFAADRDDGLPGTLVLAVRRKRVGETWQVRKLSFDGPKRYIPFWRLVTGRTADRWQVI